MTPVRQRVLVASLLVAATLALSGCWANVYNIGGGARSITLTKDFSRRLISSCTDAVGTGSARDFCALDRINGVCRTFPVKGVTEDDCVALANYANWEQLDSAIKLASGGNGCLLFFENLPPCVIDCYPNDPPTWGQTGTGEFGCK